MTAFEFVASGRPHPDSIWISCYQCDSLVHGDSSGNVAVKCKENNCILISCGWGKSEPIIDPETVRSDIEFNKEFLKDVFVRTP